MKVTTVVCIGRVLDAKRISLSGNIPDSERIRVMYHNFPIGTKLNVTFHRIDFRVEGVKISTYTCGHIEELTQ